jgi:hypothetical protein
LTAKSAFKLRFKTIGTTCECFLADTGHTALLLGTIANAYMVERNLLTKFAQPMFKVIAACLVSGLKIDTAASIRLYYHMLWVIDTFWNTELQCMTIAQ